MRQFLVPRKDSFLRSHFGKKVECLCEVSAGEVVCIDIVHDVSGRYFERYIPGMRRIKKFGLCCVDVNQKAGFDIGHHIALHPLVQIILAVVVYNHEFHIGIVSIVTDVDRESHHQVMETVHTSCAK